MATVLVGSDNTYYSDTGQVYDYPFYVAGMYWTFSRAGEFQGQYVDVGDRVYVVGPQDEDGIIQSEDAIFAVWSGAVRPQYNSDGVSITSSGAKPLNWPADGEMHFRLEDADTGFMDLGCDSGYIVSEYSFGHPQVREVSYDNSVADGTYDLTQFIGPRAVTLAMALRPTQFVDGTGIQFSGPQMLDDLRSFVHPAKRPVLVFSEHGDSRVKQIELRGSDFSAPISAPRFNRMSASWVAPTGLIESYQTHFIGAILGTEADDVDLPTQNEGNAGAHWTMTFRGEIASPLISLNGNPDTSLNLQFDSQPGDEVFIDSRSQSVFINGRETGYRYLDDNVTWFKIPPGAHFIRIDHGTATRLGYPYAFWEEDGVPSLAQYGPTSWADPPYAEPPSPDPGVDPPPPPWAWTTLADAATGLPSSTEMELSYKDTWV